MKLIIGIVLCKIFAMRLMLLTMILANLNADHMIYA